MNKSFEFIGFEFLDGVYKEYLPMCEQIYSKEQKRALFISMFNYYMPKQLRFNSKEFNTQKTLFKIFSHKIESLIPISFIHNYKMQKSFKVDVVSTNTINNFLSISNIKKGKYLTKKHTFNKKKFNKTPRLLLAKWIELIYKNDQLKILFDLGDIFTNLVYERIKKVNKDKKVSFVKNGISIMGVNEDTTSTFVVPYFSSFDTNSMQVNTQATLAKEELKIGKHNQVYFVYPKSNSFKKHIELKLPELSLNEDEYKVKLIPYSFSFCLKNIKGKHKCK